jgi:hypothetical protein
MFEDQDVKMNDRYNSMLRKMDILESQLHRLDAMRTHVLEKLGNCEKRLDAITAPIASTTMRPSESPLRQERRKRWPAVLIVKFAGKTVDHRIAARTFVEVLKMIGLERVRCLGLRVRGVQLVSRERHEGYEQWPAEGWLVVTHCATKEKRELLEEIARRLDRVLPVNLRELCCGSWYEPMLVP